MPDTAKGLKLAFVAALISGVSIFINKFAVASMGNPLILPTVKNSLVGLLFISFLIASKRWEEIKSLNKKQIFQLITIGIVGGSLPFYLFFTGLSQIPAVNANIIHKSIVIWVALLAIPFLKEKITKTQGLAVLTLFTGNLMIGGFKGLTFSTGEIMILFATLLWSIETILVKRVLNKVDPGLAATSRMGLGSLALVAFMAITEPAGLLKIATLNSTQWFWIILTSATLFGYVYTWYVALKFTTAISVSSVLVSATLITNILTAVFLTHSLNPVFTFQNLILCIGIFLLTTDKRRPAAQQTL